MRKILTLTLLLISLYSTGQKISRAEYIEKYKDIAIEEMKRCGVPASITLAQGLHESGNGNSVLAREANNHFGIKVQKEWKGPFIYVDDDKPGEKFRKYDKVEDSFYDHSNFISTKERYAFLFKLSPLDYKNWAKGLRSAGYATAKDYAQKLIKIIEDEQLYKYDDPNGLDFSNAIARNESTNELEQRIELANGKNFITIKKGDSLYAIGKYFKITVNKLLQINDMSKNEKLKIGQKIYIEKKKRRAARGYDYHLTKEGETLYSIAQEYGIKLKMLYKFNRLKKGQQLNVGQRIYMRGKAPLMS